MNHGAAASRSQLERVSPQFVQSYAPGPQGLTPVSTGGRASSDLSGERAFTETPTDLSARVTAKDRKSPTSGAGAEEDTVDLELAGEAAAEITRHHKVEIEPHLMHLV